MEGFWSIVSEWPGLGQGFFLLLVIGGFFALIKSFFRYMAVIRHGWPPDNKFPEEEEEDDDEIL
jgi:hypothetical protein